MNTIININLCGRIIPIEQNAFQMYLEYIKSLYSYFANEKERFEIINDIENRIAEMMQQITADKAACINDADTDNIITRMGTAKEFELSDKDDYDITVSTTVRYKTGTTLSTATHFCNLIESMPTVADEFKLHYN